MAWEVSTLPATTAAGGSGASMEPGGTTMSQGAQTAVVERDVVVDEGAEDVQDGGVDHGEGRVEVRGELRATYR